MCDAHKQQELSVDCQLQQQLHFMRAAHYHLTFPVHKTGQAGCGRMRPGIQMELNKGRVAVLKGKGGSDSKSDNFALWAKIVVASSFPAQISQFQETTAAAGGEVKGTALARPVDNSVASPQRISHPAVNVLSPQLG
ncbi:hypothetical protein ACLKA6_004645 [Drosophila palustris]